MGNECDKCWKTGNSNFIDWGNVHFEDIKGDSQRSLNGKAVENITKFWNRSKRKDFKNLSLLKL